MPIVRRAVYAPLRRWRPAEAAAGPVPASPALPPAASEDLAPCVSVCYPVLDLLALAPAVPAQEEDYSKVQIKSTALAPNLYLLRGRRREHRRRRRPQGVLLVDDEFAGVADKIRAALKDLGAEQPVRFVINTHYHVDHTDGNLAFAQAGAVVIAHENLRTRLERGGMAGNGGSISKEFKPSRPARFPRSPTPTSSPCT